jgi:hypothetical protein
MAVAEEARRQGSGPHPWRCWQTVIGAAIPLAGIQGAVAVAHTGSSIGLAAALIAAFFVGRGETVKVRSPSSRGMEAARLGLPSRQIWLPRLDVVSSQPHPAG